VATRVIAFDVNETLVRQMLQVGFVGAITDRYVDFTTAQRAALDMVAQRRDVTLPPDAGDRVAAAMRSLPAHPDVADALSRLRAGGHRLAALSNSPQDVERAQLADAGLTDRFDAILSADTVRALKPGREPYELTARTFGVPISEVTLVAAHAWDVAGALAAGCRAAFVAGRACRAIQSTGSRTCLAPTSARSPIGFSVLERGARNARAVVSCARMGTQRDGRCGGGNGCSRTPARAVRPRITRRDGCERDLHSGYRKDRWPST
jgi:2-haloalkanoic acid dehalogenase type II